MHVKLHVTPFLPNRDKTDNVAFALSKNLDQTMHLLCLIKIFAVRFGKAEMNKGTLQLVHSEE